MPKPWITFLVLQSKTITQLPQVFKKYVFCRFGLTSRSGTPCTYIIATVFDITKRYEEIKNKINFYIIWFRPYNTLFYLAHAVNSFLICFALKISLIYWYKVSNLPSISVTCSKIKPRNWSLEGGLDNSYCKWQF